MSQPPAAELGRYTATDTLKRQAFAALILYCMVACRDAPDSRGASTRVSDARDTIPLVVIDRSTVIGFFPPAKDSLEEAEDGYSEGVAHVGFALQDAEACLGKDRARVALVVDTAVRVQQGARIDTIRFSRVDSLSYGAYLLSPGVAPQLISVYGPSQLIPAVVEAIPAYFHRPPCTEKDD